MENRKGLGRGLSSLLGDNIQSSNITKLPIQQISPNPDQPRRYFNSQAMEELKNSIHDRGVLQPIIVRPTGEGKYQIIAGERRWRASKELGVFDIPAIVVKYNDKETLEIALIENVQRENLNPIEEAESYKKLMEEYKYSQEELAKVVARSRSHIANILRLLRLPEKVKQLLLENKISMGHARALIGTVDPEAYAEKIINQKLSVREIETIVSQKIVDPNLKEEKNTIALQINDLIGAHVDVQLKNQGGIIKIYFKDFMELDAILNKLNTIKKHSDETCSPTN